MAIRRGMLLAIIMCALALAALATAGTVSRLDAQETEAPAAQSIPDVVDQVSQAVVTVINEQVFQGFDVQSRAAGHGKHSSHGSVCGRTRGTHLGAQTESRDGAGPAGACLAVRTPPAAF